jgi:hypothetical protein
MHGMNMKGRAIGIKIFIYPQIAIQQHFYDSIGRIMIVYLLNHTIARYK